MEIGLLIAVVAVAVGLAAGGLALRVEHLRIRALRALAEERGWQLTARDDVWADEPDGEPFGRGSGRRADNVLTGRHGGRDLVAFDYSFRTHTTDANGNRRTVTHRFAVLMLGLPAPLPCVEIEAKGWLPRVVGRLLGGGLVFESEQFNDRYLVSADDPRLAYDLLPARSLQLLLDRPEIALRLFGGTAVSWDRGRLDPTELQVRLETVTALLDAVPAYVWEDRR